MRSVAIPIGAMNALASRANERKRLHSVEVIPQYEKSQAIAGYDKVIRTANETYIAKQKVISADTEKTPEEKEIAIESLTAEYSRKVDALNAARMRTQETLTQEEKAEALEALQAEDDRFNSTYGLQAPTTEDMQQKQADEDTHTKHEVERARTKYQRDRAAEYPAIGDQLDAIWKSLNGDASNAADIMKIIAEIKDKYPKPEA